MKHLLTILFSVCLLTTTSLDADDVEPEEIEPETEETEATASPVMKTLRWFKANQDSKGYWPKDLCIPVVAPWTNM